MKPYLVRTAETTKIQGVYWARNLDELWDAVDEMADPSAYEFCRITRPGGVWHDESNDDTPDIPQYGDESEGSFLPFCTASEHLSELIHTQCEARWFRLDCADEGAGFLARLRKEIDA